MFNLEVPNNKILLKKFTVDSKNKEQVNNFYNNIKTHWFNQKFEIILPINGTTNNEPIEKIKKAKGSLLSKQSLSGKLLVEAEFASLFQQYNEASLPSEPDQYKLEEENAKEINEGAEEGEEGEEGEEENKEMETDETKSTTANKNNKRQKKKKRPMKSPELRDKYSYYKIETTLDLILSQDFLNKYIRPGGFHAISQFNYIDSGNVFAILPNGEIIFNVNKETYEDLGLVGKQSVFRNSQRYIITLNSKSKELLPTSKVYSRLIWSLKDRLSSVTLICFYQKNYGVPSNQAAIIHPIQFPKGVKFKRIFNESNQSIEKYRIPTLEIINNYLNDNGDDHNNIVGNSIFKSKSKESKLLLSDFINEWIEVIGLISIDRNMEIEKDLELSNSLLSMTPIPTEIYKASLKGFVTNSLIIETISKIKRLITNGTIEYGCINIYGFADTPLSWGNIEHNFLFGGENDQSLLILPNDQYLYSNLIGSLDYYC